MATNVEKSGQQRSPLQTVAEHTAKEAQSAAIKRQDALPTSLDPRAPASGSVALPVKDRYTGAKAQARPVEASAVHEQRDRLREKRRARKGKGGAVIGGEAAAPARAKKGDAPKAPTTVGVSTERDDPFVNPAHVDQLPKSWFNVGKDGKPTALEGPMVKVVEGETINQRDQQGNLIPIANNPYSLPKPDANGNFVISDKEARFPVLSRQIGADGKPVVDKNGLQIWTPQDVHIGQTTMFESTNAARAAAEEWSGQKIKWGDEKGQMPVDPHAFIGLNAFYSPVDRGLFFGLVPYRTPGSNDIKMFEMGSSADVVRHEAGHAIHRELKPNVGLVDEGFRQWGESFADQMSMWSSLKDKTRAEALLKETGGDWSKPNALASLGELFGPLTGGTGPLRNAINDKTTKNTSDEFHDRSEVLSGASYELFKNVYANQKKAGLSDLDALQKSGDVMGQILTGVTRYTPENSMTLGDVAKGYLKYDKEHLAGQNQQMLRDEFQKRGLLTEQDLKDFDAHEAALPKLKLGVPHVTQAEVRRLLDHKEDALLPAGVGKDFGIRLQSWTETPNGDHIVRVALTEGRGGNSRMLGNAGVLTFHKDGTVADYQPAMPAGLSPADAKDLLKKAHDEGLDKQGRITIVPKPGGGYTAQAVEEVKDRKDPHLKVYDLENPKGVRREYSYREPEVKHGVQGSAEPSGALKRLLPEGATVVSPEEFAAAMQQH